MAREEIDPEGVRPGDWADHKSGELDPRKVVEVNRDVPGDEWISIDIFGGPFGPCPMHNYRFVRITED